MTGATMKPRRRGLLQGGLVLALSLLMAAPPAPATVAQEDPEAVVRTLVQHIVDLLEDGDLQGNDGIGRLATAINQDTDLDRLGRMVLGRYWRDADPAQQAEYLELFRELMLQKFVGHLGAYSGAVEDAAGLFEITGSRPVSERDVLVDSLVRPPDRPPVRASWRLRQLDDGGYVIIDLVVENVSLLISQRSEFGSVVERGGIDGLLTEMRARLGRARS